MPYDKELIAHKLIRWEHYLNNYKLPAWKELPDIGLYMDQVIALLGQYLDFIPMEDSKDKPVTPTTINNYVRLKVMPAPEKRKYYRVHIAFLIMIFTLKQGISINGLQQLLPSTADEEEIKNFYTSYVERLQEVGNFYTAQTRAAVQDILDPQVTDEGVVENVIIQSILQSGFSRIMAEKLLHLQDADPERVLELEKISDGRGRHPLGQLPEKEETSMIFDTHAHYDDEAFDPDRDAVLSALPAAGVGLVLCPGCDLDTSRQSIQLAEAYPHVYAAAGVHPEDALGLPVDWLDQVAEMTRHPKVKAIGEIGLDYYWKEVPRDLQKEVFRAQLQLAKVLDLPVIVHDREAHADCLAIVREFPGVRGVFHCYSGSAEDAKTLVKLGWHLSFTGTITFKNARKAPEVIAAVPLERIMVETDAPYMAPTPFRGKRCDSRYVYRMAETIAEIKGLTPAEVEQATTENGKALFAIP